MVVGIRIDTSGIFHYFNFQQGDYTNNDLKNMAEESGSGRFILLEEFTKMKITENYTYYLFSWTDGTNFNRFDLHYINAVGDIIVVVLDNINDLYIDAKESEILNHFKGEDLDDYLLQDELNIETSSEDTYDFDDDFLVRDEEET